MLNPAFGLAVIMLVAPDAASSATEAQAGVMAAMGESAKGWNQGDLVRFTSIYADEASFVASDGLVRGRKAIMARYAPRFAADAKRGTLAFEQLDFRLLDPAHALLIARYTLKFDGARDQSGPTSLVFERVAGKGWQIVADHSS
ncbi:YybH family protein [Sphingomonas alpina]|uniref:SgcJ/EcaC family oxidoreductase n=1 Tax=Sphingomonas alpina TaxID=653931 RepID=A0A7H0LN39_9SPHN|nr:SgcJ/EcaC family oxidoreductase [Sphingomonas alpina]QNQ11092.1 SgcJ/EcaC family oxidoreductase [Sphingomonas alpina]